MSQKISGWWTRWGPWTLAVLFIAVFVALSVLKHDSFHTRAFDLGKFDQAIWNTLRGRFLFSSLENQSILANHFSPLMALYSPLFLIWDDVRMLFVAQAIGLAVAGLFLCRIVQTKYAQLAPWYLLAFYLNPALHEVALVEVRRATMAVPFLALALYSLYTRRRVWMVVGLGLALLSQENIGLVVFMVGVYLIVFERDWRWGVPVAVAGMTWAVTVTVWAVPAIAQQPDEARELYPQLKVFCIEGKSYVEIAANVLREPQMLLGRMVDKSALGALFRIFLPVGLVLPFLAFDWLSIVVPSLAYMLMSCMPSMHRLESWYMAEVLPGLFAAVAVALNRLPERKTRWATAWLLATTVVGYVLFSHAPPGTRYEPELYQVTDHHRLAAKVVNAVPADVRVAVQDPYVPHLTHRENIYLFPWISDGFRKVDYFLLDRHLHPYPLQPDELNDVIDEMVSNTSLVIEKEGDGIYLFQQKGKSLPAFPIGATAGETMLLDRVEVAVLGEDGFFNTATQEPVAVRPGQMVRVSLYWEALDAPNADRTVSVRIVDAAGALAGQSDHMPAQGKKPTGEWQAGFKMRDVHYLTVSPQSQAGAGSLQVVVYDSDSTQVVPFEDGAEVLLLSNMVLVP